jgi:1,4-dihydroxy-2-naphthoyl-CoA hydrolase
MSDPSSRRLDKIEKSAQNAPSTPTSPGGKRLVGVAGVKHASFGPVSLTPAEIAARINQKLTGLDHTLGIEILSASAERVEAQMQIDDRHRQVNGVVHGGVYATIVETLGSVGAFVAQGSDRSAVVGMENHTSFLRAVRGGQLRAVAVPLNRGRHTQLWEVRVETEDGKLAASGRLRTLCLEDGAVLAGHDAPPLGVFEDEASVSVGR